MQPVPAHPNAQVLPRHPGEQWSGSDASCLRAVRLGAEPHAAIIVSKPAAAAAVAAQWHCWRPSHARRWLRRAGRTCSAVAARMPSSHPHPSPPPTSKGSRSCSSEGGRRRRGWCLKGCSRMLPVMARLVSPVRWLNEAVRIALSRSECRSSLQADKCADAGGSRSGSRRLRYGGSASERRRASA